ncbi:hypothetical protein D9619_012961 [Psilocybe cf. subviscida]|uniref:DUF6535 domain-containing protein n=1 Tax=Psilocybe cf. subviscida TaxID=2480587 RepID=A0A8H5BIP6_9AGAR|nr:hypothetical protein D9619_012961 [Psilocybe cf. subviscida]
MSSEPKVAEVENSSPLNATVGRQADANQLASTSLHPQVGTSTNLDEDTFHKSEGEIKTANEPKIPRLSDVYSSKPQKPEGDPNTQVFKLLLQKDTIQCKAWEDEVQNILLFAALFSAVITAFIIESYQRLRPDSNDTIINLLAHIAERMDGTPLNGTSSVSSILSGSKFSPSQLDIRINILWFISLILSLTAALIGIITLQWLREHRRYDTAETSKDTVGILNLRRHSLKQWYVPQIFAALPLIVQGSLIFFFAGIVEFLFGLDVEVAIPVTLCISIPVIFLLATTMLPLIQLYILQSPFGQPAQVHIPSPCPYKSPQSIIVRRIGIKVIVAFITGVHRWITPFTTMLAKALRQLPHQRSTRLPPEIDNNRHAVDRRNTEVIAALVSAPGDWASMDKIWLDVRAEYASSLQLARTTFYSQAQNVPFRALNYDNFVGFRRILSSDLTSADAIALYHCMDRVCSQQVDEWMKWFYWRYYVFEDGAVSVLADIFIALDQLLHHSSGLDFYSGSVFSRNFIKDVVHHQDSDGEALEFLQATLLSSCLYEIAANSEQQLLPFWHEMNSRMIIARLQVPPQRLFTMEDGDTWLPEWMIESNFDLSDKFESIVRVHATSLLHGFFVNCSKMQIDSTPRHRDRNTHKGVSRFMRVAVRYQSIESLNNTLVRLKEMCESQTTQDAQFLPLAACFYIDAIAYVQYFPLGDAQQAFDGLVRLIVSRYTIKDAGVGILEWRGLYDAIKSIYSQHTDSNDQQELSPLELESV